MVPVRFDSRLRNATCLSERRNTIVMASAYTTLLINSLWMAKRRMTACGKANSANCSKGNCCRLHKCRAEQCYQQARCLLVCALVILNRYPFLPEITSGFHVHPIFRIDVRSRLNLLYDPTEHRFRPDSELRNRDKQLDHSSTSTSRQSKY
jgi:hypothetical protein